MCAEVIAKPKVNIDPDILAELEVKTYEENQVVLHFIDIIFGSAIRIWPTTYLYDLHSSHRSELVYAENISLYPDWQVIDGFTHFTLVFTGLPKTCTVFNFIEDCGGEMGGFRADNISRNTTDVYFLSC